MLKKRTNEQHDKNEERRGQTQKKWGPVRPPQGGAQRSGGPKGET